MIREHVSNVFSLIFLFIGLALDCDVRRFQYYYCMLSNPPQFGNRKRRNACVLLPPLTLHNDQPINVGLLLLPLITN